MEGVCATGSKVFNFEISGSNLDIGSQNYLDITIDLKVEPVSGTTVYSHSLSTSTYVPAPGVRMTTSVSDVAFTEDTIKELVDTASSARTTFLWAKVYGFWLGIGLGIVLTLVGTLGAIRTRPKEVA